MMRRVWHVIIWLVLLGLVSPAYGQDGVEVVQSEAEIQFGQLIRFHLEATSDAEIESATLSFTAESMVDTLTKNAGISQTTTTLEASTTIDITTTRLRPFATLTYWWDLTTTTGDHITTPLQTTIYQDNRLNWQTLTRNNITIYWADGDNKLALSALTVVDEVLPKLLGIMPASLPPNLQIYLYPSQSDLRATLQLAGYDWVAGQAIPEFGAIAIALPDQTTATVELQRTLPHELSHLLFHQSTAPHYDNAPIWLDEGLATFVETEVNLNQVEVLSGAINAGTTIPLDQLCLRFPTDGQNALLAYAQSRSLVHFIQQQYGDHALTQMVAVIADGAGCEATVRRVLGISALELEQKWLNNLHDQPFGQRMLQDNSLLWLFAIGFMGLFTLLWLNPIRIEK